MWVWICVSSRTPDEQMRKAFARPSPDSPSIATCAAAGLRAAPPRRSGSCPRRPFPGPALRRGSPARSAGRSRCAAGRRARTTSCRIVTGPVSMPFIGFFVSDCAYCHHSTVIGFGRRDVAEQDRRLHAARAVGLHPAVGGEGKACELLAEVLDHVVALELAVHEHVEADLLPASARAARDFVAAWPLVGGSSSSPP